MAPKPKKVQKVEVNMLSTTVKMDHSKPSDKPVALNYGEHHIFNCGIPYDGARRSLNCTVNAAELQRGITKQKADYAKTVLEHQEYRRVPKGKRVLIKLPSDKADTPETTRIEH